MSIPALTIAFYFIFGFFNQVGGFIGYLKAGSKASLVAGIIAGVLLETAALLLIILPDLRLVGLLLGGAVSLLLLGRFIPAFLKQKKIMPAGFIVLLGLISLGLTIANFL